MLPAPPRLKTTIIQLNKDIDPEDHNYEVLSNDYNQCSNTYGVVEEPAKKKRRRSSSFVDKDELARRKAETKQLHSKIEKRRRIKINREFEALQYLIPACRAVDGSAKKLGIRSISSKPEGTRAEGSKCEGMYKLTILKTSVEYILYLHHIIQKQHEMLRKRCSEYDFDISFSEVRLDVNQYRNIDQEYIFGGDVIVEEAAEVELGRPGEIEYEGFQYGQGETERKKDSDLESESDSKKELELKELGLKEMESKELGSKEMESKELGSKEMESKNVLQSKKDFLIEKNLDSEKDLYLQKSSESPKLDSSADSEFSVPSDNQLWTPSVTPVMACMQGPKTRTKAAREDPRKDDNGVSSQFWFQNSHRGGSLSLETSPFTIPINSSVKNGFLLPDPALTYTPDSRDTYTRDQMSSMAQVNSVQDDSYMALPRKKFFKSKVPAANSVINLISEEQTKAETDELVSVAKASEALLTFRKPSIERLLN